MRKAVAEKGFGVVPVEDSIMGVACPWWNSRVHSQQNRRYGR